MTGRKPKFGLVRFCISTKERKSLLVPVAVFFFIGLPFTTVYGQGGIDNDPEPDFITSWGGYGGSQVWEVPNTTAQDLYFTVGSTSYGAFTDGVVSIVDGGGNDAILISRPAGEIHFVEGMASTSIRGKAEIGGVPVTGYTKVSPGYLTSPNDISIIASNGSAVRIFDYNPATKDFDDIGVSVAGYDDVTAGYVEPGTFNGTVLTNSGGASVWGKVVWGNFIIVDNIKHCDGVANVTGLSHPELGNVDGDTLADLVAMDGGGTIHWYEYDTNLGTFVDTQQVSATGYQDISLGNDADRERLWRNHCGQRRRILRLGPV